MVLKSQTTTERNVQNPVNKEMSTISTGQLVTRISEPSTVPSLELAYLPTFELVNVGKYASPMDAMGYIYH